METYRIALPVFVRRQARLLVTVSGYPVEPSLQSDIQLSRRKRQHLLVVLTVSARTQHRTVQ
jgi:hypothetical protein